MQRQDHFQADLPRGLPRHSCLAMGGVPEVARRDEEKVNAVCGQVFGTVRIAREWVGEQ